MTNKELLDAAVANGIFNGAWTYCFNSQCDRHAECARFLSTTLLPKETDWGYAIFPNACQGGKCRHFLQLHKVQLAWGFSNTFDNVRTVDVDKLRWKMWGLLGSRTSYYRYNSGERKLLPKQQAAISRLFASFGYDTVVYDHVQESVVAL